jgi:hypothetical protein
MTKTQTPNEDFAFLDLGHWDLGFVWDFGYLVIGIYDIHHRLTATHNPVALNNNVTHTAAADLHHRGGGQWR